MHKQEDQPRRLKIGSLFSGYGGLDLAVEHAFNAQTVWFSELNEPVARVFARYWSEAPNLGDITAIDWSQVEPVDILIGGFPCQDISVNGKGAGINGKRSGWGAARFDETSGCGRMSRNRRDHHDGRQAA